MRKTPRAVVAKSRSGREAAGEQRAVGPLVEARAEAAECVLDGGISGEVALFTRVFGEVVELFAPFHFAAEVGPVSILE